MTDAIRVTVWNEFRQERSDPPVRAIYPDGMHAAIADGLRAHGGLDVRTATLDDADQGLSDESLATTDVLTWWGHKAHGAVGDAVVERVAERVWEGMGLIVLHSGHFSKIFKRLMGTPCSLKWREAGERRWSDLASLNAWLAERCRQCWEETHHPEWPTLTIAEVLQDERARLMPCPKPFDGYVEQPVRVSATALVHFQRNRYSVPTRHVNEVLSLRVYPDVLVLVAEGVEIARHVRSFERHQTCYDWQHYIPLVQTKPGALRNGAPFKAMPEVLQTLQRHLLRHAGGDRVMAQVLAAVPLHGLEAVLVAAELALEAGRPSAEHVLNVLARLKDGLPAVRELTQPTPVLREEPRADVQRYDRLRGLNSQETQR